MALYSQTEAAGGYSISHSARDCGPVNTCITLGPSLPMRGCLRLILKNQLFNNQKPKDHEYANETWRPALGSKYLQ